jgi:hypothetical protein
MSDMNRRWLLAKRPRGMVGPENFDSISFHWLSGDVTE